MMAAIIRYIGQRPNQRTFVCCCQHICTYGKDDPNRKRSFSQHKLSYLYRVPRTISIPNYTWSYSNICYKSKYLQTPPVLSNISLYEDCFIKRSFHSTASVLKEDSFVEKSVKELKDELSVKKHPDSAAGDKVIDQKPRGFWAIRKAKWSATLQEMKKTGYLKYFWNAFKSFVLHYKDGFVLFWKNLKFCLPLFIRYLRQGRSSLKRREYKMLTKTLADMFRMVPLIPMVIIPLGEILIPFYVKLGMMPSVFQNKTEKSEFKRQLQTKVEYAQLLTASLHDIPLKKDSSGSTIKDFTEFMEKVKNDELIPSMDEIAKFSALFADAITLDDLNVVQLQALCKLLGIGFLGQIPSAPVLRFQITMKVRELEVDDRIIEKEGLESLSSDELQAANRARGMQAIGLSQERLKLQLQQWLELHLKLQVPTSLLLLSRVMYLDSNMSPAQQLKQTISALPETTVEKVKVSSAESKGEEIDKKTKIKILEEEYKAIVKEKQLEEEEKKKADDAGKLEEERKRAAQAKKTEEQLVQEKEIAELALQEMEKARISRELAVKLQEGRPDIAQDISVEAEDKEKARVPEVSVEKEITEEIKPVEDIAEPIVTIPEEEEEDITAQDLGDIEKAIESLAIHHQDELLEVKEDLDEYLEDIEDIKSLCEDVDYEKRFNETKGAELLRGKLNKYLKKIDHTISGIQDTKMELQAKLEQQEVSLKYDLEGNKDELMEDINIKKGKLISVNDILLSLKRLQKVPDDVRMQKILQVLDTDEDGLIDITDVLKVTELLGSENLKLNKSQVTAMINLLKKEEEFEQVEKQREKEEKMKEGGASKEGRASGEEGEESNKNNNSNQQQATKL